MNALSCIADTSAYRISLASPDDFEGWRDAARRLLCAAVPPERVKWDSPVDAVAGDLFACERHDLPAIAGADLPRVPRQFVQLTQSALLHSDGARFSLAYRVLWRLQANPRLIGDKADADIRALENLARQVRRDMHKMRAFLRFRAVADADGERYVAWFEPDHHILRANAGFFVRRFGSMHWSILTPRGSLHWDGTTLCEGPSAMRADAPSGDPVEALWRGYYASTFNPARLKIGAMLKEMPRRYWKNMPESVLIPELIAGAQAREARMVRAGEQDFGPSPAALEQVRAGIATCQRCAIGCTGTQAVMGEGPSRASLMIVGEQPGDNEERQGRPFIGPAGQLLRLHMAQAGLDAAGAYMTNAVKHFKFTPTVTRRLHQTPTAAEIDVCRWWLEGERALIRPKLVLALGASAARSVLGRTLSVQKVRGQPQRLEDGSELWITTHPSYLLRLDQPARAREESLFANELRAVATRLRELDG